MKDIIYYGEYAARSKDDIILSFTLGLIATGFIFLLGLAVGVNL